MKLLKSKILELPLIYFITDREEIKELPVGVPFMYASKKEERSIIRIMEYEIIYQNAVKTGFPFDFKQLLKEAGFKGLRDFRYARPIYMEYVTEGFINDDEELDFDIDNFESIKDDDSLFKQYIHDTAVYVDITVLKGLNVFPVWLNVVEEAISTNIHNFALYNPNMYNKKLEGMYGNIDLVSPNKNLIVIDISGSIPKGVSSTCLALAKNWSESFYADILITGTKSVLYPYEEVYKLDVDTIYRKIGTSNDQTYFKALLSGDEKHYKTAIVFGDNDAPGYNWGYNSSKISDKDGKKLCKWKVDKLIALHTCSSTQLPGYSRWFSPTETEHIDNWVKYL